MNSEPGQKRMADLLQRMEDEMSGFLVGSFLVIMELEMPNDPDGVAYHVFRKGTPATQLGLVDYLSGNVHEHVFLHKDE